MNDFVVRLESCLQAEFGRLASRKLKLVRVTGDRNEVDYFYPILPVDLDKFSADDVNGLFENHQPWMTKYVTISIVPEQITVRLVRDQILSQSLQSLLPLGPSYGNNDLMSGQVVKVVVEGDNNSGGRCLTGFRAKLAGRFLCRLLAIAGCENGACDLVYDDDSHNAVHRSGNDREVTVAFVLNWRRACKRSHTVAVLIGPVVQPVEGDHSRTQLLQLSVDDYLSIKTREIESMCHHKLEGATVSTADDLKEFVNAAVTFELLQSTIFRSVSLVYNSVKSEESPVGSSCKGGLFVLYNYVRLSSLSEKFDDQVSLKVYPALPPVNEIDFSLLTDENEWKLVYDYILRWPKLLKECVESLKTGKPKIHTVLQFLTSLASTYSLYYRRIRLLIEPRAHLLPTLFSRIYLLRALREIFRKGLSLLSIQPPARM